MPEIGRAVEDIGWGWVSSLPVDIMTFFISWFCSLPTDVQAEAIPLILGGGDVLMAAETGSGKTGEQI